MTSAHTIGSMFSGIGGLDLAVERALGAHPAWFCEWDDAPARILENWWPGVPNFRDVTLINWADMIRVHVLTGGYPCQPFSAAGRRKGTDDERHLWPHCLAALNTLRPRWAFFENVAGHLTLGFDIVTRDLAVHDWHVRWYVCRASDIGATHHRRRVFIGVSREPWPVPAGARAIARIDESGEWVEPDSGLFGAIPFAGRWPNAGAVVDGVAYEVDVDVAAQAAVDVLPTPTVGNATGTNERRGGARGDEMLLPGVAVAAARGELADPVLPTPVAQPSGNTPEQAARHSPPLSAVSAHFPTPRSSRGGSATETMYALGGVRDDTDRPQGEVVLPTPLVSDAANPGPADTGRNTPQLRAIDALLPTRDTGQDPEKRRAAGRQVSLADVTCYLPTPEAKLGSAGPDYARVNRPGSGGDDLATAVDRAARERGTNWGKYQAAIDRWARVIGRPAPSPTEPNRNGKPRLAARFAEWMMGWPEGHVTGETDTAWRTRLARRREQLDPRPVGHRGSIARWESPISRAEQLKAIGNGVVDLQAEHAIRTIMSWPARAEVAA